MDATIELVCKSTSICEELGRKLDAAIKQLFTKSLNPVENLSAGNWKFGFLLI